MEAQLVVRARVGEPGAFDELVRASFASVFRLCRRYARGDAEAEDLAQECFLLAYRGLGKLRGGFRGWILRIALNVCRSHLRRRLREDRRLARLAAERPPQADARPAGMEELRELVSARIAALPGRQREILLLHLDASMSHEEIAQTLGIRYEAVKASLSLARRRLRQELAHLLEEGR